MPDFPEIELSPGVELPEDCTLEDVDTLRSIYREHCEVTSLKYYSPETLLKGIEI